MTQDTSFNLVDEPWVRIRDENGNMREVSLLELFNQAPHIKCLANDLPTQDFAIVRLALAILQRSIVPTVDEDDDPSEVWGELWNAGELPMPQIESYLALWHKRFDLFDGDEPFMQIADLHTPKNDYSDVKKIIADVPDGEALFSLRSGIGVESLSYAEAARWLVHAQAFDPAGIKSGTVGDPRVKNGKSYPIGIGWAGGIGGLYFEGHTLFETMLLNFIACDADEDVLFPFDDVPSWERPVEKFGEDDRFPTGRLDLFTWQSRRIRLVPRDGRVAGVVLTNGDKIDSRNLNHLEPMTAWRRSLAQEKKQKSPLPIYMPRIHQPDRALWRGLDSVFGSDGEEEAPSVIPPGIETWLSYLASSDGGNQIGREYLLMVHAVGFEYGTQNSVIVNVIDDKVELKAFLLSRKGRPLVTLAKQCAEETSRGVTVLGNLAGNLCKAAGGSGADEINGAISASKKQAYFEVDASFRSWLAGLDEASDLVAARERWRRLARSKIAAVAGDLLQDLGPDAIVGAPVRGTKNKGAGWMTASRAEGIFRSALKKALPLEDDQETKKEVR